MIKRILIATASVFVLLLIATSWLIMSETGLRQLVRMVSRAAPVDIQVEQVGGRLVGPFDLANVLLDTDSMRVEIGGLALDWHPMSLLAGHLVIASLVVEEVRVEQLVASDEPFVLPDQIALPFGITLDNFEMKDLSYSGANTDQPITLQRVRLDAVLGDEKFLLSGIDLLANQVTLRGGIDVEPSMPYAISSDLDWEIRIPELPALAGSTQLSGDLNQLDINLSLLPPWEATGSASIEDLLQIGRVTADLNIPGLALDQISAGTPSVTIGGQVNIDMEDGVVTFDTDSTISLPDELTSRVSASGNYAGDMISIAGLEVALPGENTRLVAEANIDLSGQEPMARASASWTELRWPLNGPASFGSQEGRLAIAGSPGSYQITSDFLFDGPEGLNTPVRLEGTGTADTLLLDRIALTNFLDGTVTGELSASWADEVKAVLTFSGGNLNPESLLSGANGNLNLVGAANLLISEDSGYSLNFDLDLDGKLLEKEIVFNSDGVVAEQGLLLNRFDLSSGESRLFASGIVGPELQFDWDIASPDLADLLPGSTGSLNSSGTARGELTAPVVEGSIAAVDFSWRGHMIREFSAIVDVDPFGDSESSVLMEIVDGTTGNIEISAATLTVDGMSSAHTITLDAVSSLADLGMHIEGELGGLDTDMPVWSFKVGALDLLPKRALGEGRAWNIAGPTAGSWSGNTWQLDEMCMVSSEITAQDGDPENAAVSGRLCAAGQQLSDAIDLTLMMDSIPLNYFTEYFYPELDIFGSLGGSVRIGGRNIMNPTIEARLESTETDIRSVDRNGNDFRILKVEPTVLNIVSNGKGLSTTFNLVAPDVGSLNLDIRVGDGDQPIAERALSGSVDLEVPDVSPFIAFLPEVEELSGNISGFATLSGTLSDPVVGGQLELLQGNVAMPDLGLELTGIYLQAKTAEGTIYEMDGEMLSCAGAIRIDGALNLGDEDIVSILNVKGDNFEFCNSATFQLTVSPDIQIRTQGRNMEITGDIVVPQADIRPASGAGPSGVSTSPDQVIIVSDTDDRTLPLLISSEVTVSLGDEVRFNGFGLQTRLAGIIGITDPPGRPTLARGELILLDGTFTGYGQQLEIEQGRLLFAGGLLTQPGISLRAVRRPNRSVVVGIDGSGNLANPRLELFSDPSMSAAEQLAWLTTGRPLSGLNDTQSSSLTQTALALSMAGESPIADRVGNRLGLDQFGLASTGGGFEGDAGDQSSLMLGKMISPRLFISYAIGLFEPVNVLRAEFSINDNWKLVTETNGVNNRADVVYQVEKGSVGKDEVDEDR